MTAPDRAPVTKPYAQDGQGSSPPPSAAVLELARALGRMMAAQNYDNLSQLTPKA